MSAENEQKVSDFCFSWLKGDLAASAEYLSEDVTYHNVPWEPVTGREGFLGGFKQFVRGDVNMLQKMEIFHSTSSGNIIMNERSELWVLDDVEMVLPVTGMFEINADGKICRWHDYFDAKTAAPLLEAMSKKYE